MSQILFPKVSAYREDMKQRYIKKGTDSFFSYLFTVFFRFQFENYDLPFEDPLYQCHKGMYVLDKRYRLVFSYLTCKESMEY